MNPTLTPEEKTARRIRIAQAMGWKIVHSGDDDLCPWRAQDPDGNKSNISCSHEESAFELLPDPDTDPAALLAVMEWIRIQEWFLDLRILPTRGSNIARVRLAFKTDDEFGTDEAHCKADTLTEAILAAIDSALIAQKGEQAK